MSENQENFIRARGIKTYSESHLGEKRGEIYDSKLFSGFSYSNAIWQLEKHILDGILKNRNDFYYLDFACGTGRVAEYLESKFADSYALDVSYDMIKAAEGKLKKTKLIAKDILKDDSPELENKFDVITGFRFFLNAEGELKNLIIEKLKTFLKPGGLLVFNIHQHRFSLNFISEKIRTALKKEESPACNWMTVEEVKNLVTGAGLKIRDIYSYAVLPRFLYRYLPQKVWFMIEKKLISRKIIIGSHLIVVASSSFVVDLCPKNIK